MDEKHPESLTGIPDYADAPTGTQVRHRPGGYLWTKNAPDQWVANGGFSTSSDASMGGTTRIVERWGLNRQAADETEPAPEVVRSPEQIDLDDAQGRIDTLTQQVRNQAETLEAALAQIEAQRAERNDLDAALLTALQERDAAWRERDDLLAECAASRRKCDTLEAVAQGIARERDAARRDNDRIREEAETAVRAMTDALAEREEERDRYRDERDEFRQRCDAAVRDRDAARSERRRAEERAASGAVSALGLPDGWTLVPTEYVVRSDSGQKMGEAAAAPQRPRWNVQVWGSDATERASFVVNGDDVVAGALASAAAIVQEEEESHRAVTQSAHEALAALSSPEWTPLEF